MASETYKFWSTGELDVIIDYMISHSNFLVSIKQVNKFSLRRNVYFQKPTREIYAKNILPLLPHRTHTQILYKIMALQKQYKKIRRNIQLIGAGQAGRPPLGKPTMVVIGSRS